MQETTYNAGDGGLIPGSRRFPEEGNGKPLQYSCLRNPTDRGAWWATAHGVARVGHDLATNTPPCAERERGGLVSQFFFIHVLSKEKIKVKI